MGRAFNLRQKLALLCDFDGTIAKGDVGFRIYTHFGDERWEEINKRWRRGEISSKECLIGEYSFIDASEEEVRKFVSEMEIDTGFIDLLEACRKNDIPIAIVSDGFDFYIKALLEKYGISDVDIYCNNLVFNGRKVQLSFPYYDQGCGKCGNCKVLHVINLKNEGRTVIYIGDGLSDKFASRFADVIFAKDELMEYLESNGIEFNKFSCLDDVHKWLNSVLIGNVELSTTNKDNKTLKDCPKIEEKETIKKLKMKKIKKDMGDGRYIVYYEWSDED
ncbi:TPA: hypothetical protein ENX78_08680 [Candidatus Poribacteria bacterium]|nr:hypothetical protein [Candidatus Poribacteria bacterium]